MDFLKEILGDDLYTSVVEKINAHNGNEVNRDKQVKLGNLASGEYVGKGKYDALNDVLTGKEVELKTANDLITELKKASKGDEALQGKITTYEAQITELQRQLRETELKSAVKVALLSEKAVDVDYLTYKLSQRLGEKGETLELDENGNIKGWDDKLSGLKTQFPAMFESVDGNAEGYQVLGDNKLPGRDSTETLTKEGLLKMPYADRAKIAQEKPEAYNAAMHS